MKRLVTGIACLTCALAFSFGPGAANASTMKYTVHLKGMNEVGAPGAPHGSGTATITVNMSKHTLCYTISVTGFKLPAIAAHIHAGHAGKNGPIVVKFNNVPNSKGKSSGCTMVSSKLLKAITGHPSSYYVNVHTTQYPGGAVRGQV
ncbi:MAG TPA: CHRD domain-containing protein [Chloroflexota bacterium]|nr:CHRD domain-containing protein [Chloroflexota bacterium]